jgi:NAD(P) transhydrogenase subunit beta
VPGLLGDLPESLRSLAYLASGVLFILGLRGMTHPRTARRGNLLSAAGMFLAVGVTVLWFEILSPVVLLAALLVGGALGAWLAITVEATALPQLVGLFNGLGGGASALVAGAELVDLVGTETAWSAVPLEVRAGGAVAGLVGAVTFWGSLLAAGKLHGVVDRPLRYRGETAVRAAVALAGAVAVGYLVFRPGALGGGPSADWLPAYWALVLAASVLGLVVVAPIGGADMPVVIALLNACSGLAAATTGFVLDLSVLVVAGALVGASGFILTTLMCRAMNRSLVDVLAGGFGATGGESGEADAYADGVMATSPEEVGVLLSDARRVVIVPGYGMAVGQAQHAVAELARMLAADGVDVAFGVHPVAGRLPGHMNVLLAEANVPYELMHELEAVNPTFPETDVVLVTGANDVVNPTALSDAPSPIAGMPVLEVWEARTVIVNKRSLSPGYAGIPNPLFTRDNSYMLFGDAKESMQAVVAEYEASRRHSRGR